jgi:Holliday junction DNA helicase RuvA
MIGALRGKVWRKMESTALIDCGGVGYLVTMSSHGLAKLGPVGSDASVDVHTHVREDALSLFAFADEYEKDVFELLLSVSGVGPKMAINVLSGMPVERLVKAIATDDLAALTKISGVGKKTAERLLLELRSGIKKLGGGVTPSAKAGPVSRTGEVASALLNLGYKPAQVEGLVERLLKEFPEHSFEELVREALKSLR